MYDIIHVFLRISNKLFYLENPQIIDNINKTKSIHKINCYLNPLNIFTVNYKFSLY